jgi:hypothetical protein
MLFDDHDSNPGFSEMACPVTADHTLEFVNELFGPEHPMLYDMKCGRPWAVVEP